MEQVRTCVTLARALREDRKLKVRQPLAKLTWVIPEAKSRKELAPFLPIVADEINVKHVEMIEGDEQLASLSAAANFRVLGKKVGGKMKEIAEKIAKISSADLKKIESGGTITIDEFVLSSEDIQIRREEKSGLALKSDGYMTVALDTELTPELLAEGMAREIVHTIQNERKESGLEITDRISIDLSTPSAELRRAVESFEDYICRETLALNLKLNGSTQGQEFQTGGHPYSVRVVRMAEPS
jgi:isoleucyl-tRNA synthetase